MTYRTAPPRVLLIGGTSHTGKSRVAAALADRLGFECRSTDHLARHPGRPWDTPDWQMPPHVAEHYDSLTLDELIASVLDHYERLWPRIEQLIAEHAEPGASTEDGASTEPPSPAAGSRGLVLEGSALWPTRVATLRTPHTAAVWLTADDKVLRTRIHASSDYSSATDRGRHLIDKFLARTLRYQTLMTRSVDELGLPRLDSGDGRPPAALTDAVLAAAGARRAAPGSEFGAGRG
ncbi:hypothetical protein DY218_13030, partial [Streptomyces triticagri]